MSLYSGKSHRGTFPPTGQQSRSTAPSGILGRCPTIWEQVNRYYRFKVATAPHAAHLSKGPVSPDEIDSCCHANARQGLAVVTAGKDASLQGNEL